MSTTQAQTKPVALDEAKVQAFLGKAVVDCGAMLSSALVVIGDKLGLCRAMQGAGPLTPEELAQLAQAYPNSRFYGFDNHAGSIERARQLAQEAGVADHVIFEVASSTEFPGEGYDLVAFFDCLHDIGDPVKSLKHAQESLAEDGTVLLVEPMAGERVEEAFNSVGRFYSGASVLVCIPNGLATGSHALGSQASEGPLRQIAEDTGLTRFRRAAETGFNRMRH
ncbi:MAG TPA: class I SAM-dependent methyltransferase [Ktedonobacterales bacterium]|jgi:SAM-dependent methyltransferase|nr:class I SAM-dependent methyltransferase [Ktedonobacterales bacterium]